MVLGRGSPRKNWMGCAVDFPKLLPYLRLLNQHPVSDRIKTSYLIQSDATLYCERHLLIVLLIMMKNLASCKNNSAQFRTRWQDHTLFQTKTTKIDTLFITQTAEKPYHFGRAHAYRAHKRTYSLRGCLHS